MAVLVTCQAISKHFGTRTLFDGLSISFADGERVGFLGPNGAGKTTFLKMLADLEQVDGGEVNRRRSARIGFLPQEDRFSDGQRLCRCWETRWRIILWSRTSATRRWRSR